MTYFNKLNGDMVYLSPMNPDDYEIYTKWINDLSTSIPLGSASRNCSVLNEKEFIDNAAKTGQNFAICKKGSDELIGNASLFSINHINRTAEVGLFIGEETNRGKGYGTEVLKLLLCYAFKILNLNNIMLKVFSFNEQAISSYKKAGFIEFGRRVQAYYLNDKYYDELYMQILKSEFYGEYLTDKMPS